MELSDEEKNTIIQFQVATQQLKAILEQKESLRLQSLLVDSALEELSKSKQKTGYKIVGSIMVLKPINELKKELDETKENLNLRIKSLEKSEEKINEKIKELQPKLAKIQSKLDQLG